MIGFAIDPFNTLFKVCNVLYPEKTIDVYFVPSEVIVEILKDNDSKNDNTNSIALECKGNRNVIYVNSHIPVSEAIETTMAQVAKLVVNSDDDELIGIELEKMAEAYCQTMDQNAFQLEQQIIHGR